MTKGEGNANPMIQQSNEGNQKMRKKEKRKTVRKFFEKNIFFREDKIKKRKKTRAFRGGKVNNCWKLRICMYVSKYNMYY